MEDAAPVTRCLLFIRFLPEMMFRSLFQPEVLLCFQAIFSLFYLLVIPGQFAFAAGDLYCLLPGEWEETEAGSGYGNTTGPLCVVDGENTLTFSSTFFVSYIVDAAFFVTCLILLWRAMPSKLKSILCYIPMARLGVVALDVCARSVTQRRRRRHRYLLSD